MELVDHDPVVSEQLPQHLRPDFAQFRHAVLAGQSGADRRHQGSVAGVIFCYVRLEFDYEMALALMHCGVEQLALPPQSQPEHSLGVAAFAEPAACSSQLGNRFFLENIG